MQVTTRGATVVLAGRFDVRSTAVVRELLYKHISSSNEDVIVDMSALESIDVTALKVLAAATRVVERDGRHLVLRGLQSRPAARHRADPVAQPRPDRAGRVQPLIWLSQDCGAPRQAPRLGWLWH